MRILIVEDEEKLCFLLQFHLEKEGYHVETCHNGADAQLLLESDIYDLILLDRMLPKIDGITLLKEYRKKGMKTPIIILTALGEVCNRIEGLDSGADDYITKPFDFEELNARIRSILRRPQNYKNNSTLSFSDLSYNPHTNQLSGPKGNCTLTQKEGELFELFLNRSNEIIARAVIISKVWGSTCEIEDGNLDNYIYFLRRRLNTVGSFTSIKTIRGKGYQLIGETQINEEK